LPLVKDVSRNQASATSVPALSSPSVIPLNLND
jgi:hypothetical protein